MAEIYEPISNEEIKVTTETVINVKDLIEEKAMMQLQVDSLAEQMAIIDSKLVIAGKIPN